MTDGFPQKSHSLVRCHDNMRLYVVLLQFGIFFSNTRERYMEGRLAKETMWNIVMALSTLPELHVIILYLATFFFFLFSEK